MATTLVVPGVRVDTRFDVLPPLPAPAGILGVVGIVDRPGKKGDLAGVTKVAELRELLGPGTAVSMPQAVHALANGVSEVIVSPVHGGGPASVTLNNKDGLPALKLRARSAGAWANDELQVEVRETTDTAGKPLRVTLRLLRDNAVVETHADLRSAAGQPDDLIDSINRTSSYVVALDPGTAELVPVKLDGTFTAGTPVAPLEVKDKDGKPLLQLRPADGAAVDGLRVVLTPSQDGRITVEVFQNGLQERHTDLSTDPDDPNYLPFVLATQSRLIRARGVSSNSDAAKALPAAGPPTPFAGGTSPTNAAFLEAIDLLADDTRIDLVLAAVEPTMTGPDVRIVHQALVAHAVTMADNGAPRIAFGSVTAAEQTKVDDVRDHASVARNRRFVLVSPAGAEGALAGVVGRMSVQDSPTFKSIPLFDLAPARYRESQLNVLLGPTVNACVVQDRRGRGVVCLKGIDTTGDQISVTRVADACIRETKAIAENFIGSLNTDAARVALKQQLIATFTRLERAGALVPSTDGSDPSFVVDVYSTQQDFAQGIVRIDIAVRPVRAIDYVYATIRVKN